jgi:hypothetical protein
MELLGTDFMPATFDLSVLKGATCGRFSTRLRLRSHARKILVHGFSVRHFRSFIFGLTCLGVGF